MYNNYISHIGVKGMRWGFKKHDAEAASAIIKEGKTLNDFRIKKRTAKDTRLIKTITRDSLREMSDNDLKNLVARMNLEKQYTSLLVENNVSSKSRVKDMLDMAGTVAVTATSVMAIVAAFDKHALGKKTLASAAASVAK